MGLCVFRWTWWLALSLCILSVAAAMSDAPAVGATLRPPRPAATKTSAQTNFHLQVTGTWTE